MSDIGTTAPKERINIVYKPAIGDVKEQMELPMRLVVMGDFKAATDDIAIENRQTTSIGEGALDDIISRYNPQLKLSVENKLSKEENAPPLGVNLSFKKMDDFHPDNLAKSFPEIDKLMQLRNALKALKGPLGNVSQFRRHLEEIVQDETARDSLLKELNIEEKQGA